MLFALATAGEARPASPADAYVRRIMELVSSQQREIGRLEEPARRTGQALLHGAAFWIAGAHAGWVSEATGRAGGTAAAMPLSSPEAARQGDAVWLSFSAATYAEDLKIAVALENKGCIVTTFGPDVPSSHSDFPHRLANGTRWTDDEHVALMGSVLSLWSLTAEVVSYAARHGKTLAMLQSVVVPGGAERDAKYRKTTFHADGIRMQPMPAGVLAREYLDAASAMLAQIRDEEWNKLMSLAAEVGRCAKASHPASLRMIGHLMPHVADSKLFETGGAHPDERDSLAKALRHSRLLVWLGYTEIPADLIATVRSAGARAAWMAASDAAPGTNTSDDMIIDQHWRTGDAAVSVPGYDIPILPPSALAQLFLYDILVRSAR